MKILFISLGCDKNLVDSEEMLGLINNHGYTITNDEYEAEVIIINTCCFIDEAKQESIDTILEYAKFKEIGNLKALIVTGCMAERYKSEIKKELPEVDGVLGFTNNSETSIIEVIENLLGKKDYKSINNKKNRLLTTGGHFAYLKIAEGCDKHCTYCAIPMIRGKYRSKDIDLLIDEAKLLAEQGVKELILVAQETTLYGTDIYGEKTLPRLLNNLCKIKGIKWIRLLYCYPEEITDDLIHVIKTQEKIVKYIDIPIQHSSDRILKLMGRKTSKDDLINVINKLRKNIPGIILRTTLITGFPTETQEDHEEVLDFIQDIKFERLGAFTYSREENTPAALLKPQIDTLIKDKRYNEIMNLQQDIMFDFSKTLINKELEVIIEGKITDEEDVYIGRTYMDMPNVDGYMFLKSEEELITGDFVNVIVTSDNGYDLIGEKVKK